MRRKETIMALTAVMAISMSSTAFAAGWQKDSTGWRWQNDNGSYSSNAWQWIDGNHDGIAECYYFDGNGYCLMNTQTPDGYSVNADGAWAVNGVVQTQRANGSVSVNNSSSISGTYKYTLVDNWGGQEYRIDTIYEITEQADGSIALYCEDVSGVTIYTKVGINSQGASVYEAPCSDSDTVFDTIVIEGNTLTEICKTYDTERVFQKQ